MTARSVRSAILGCLIGLVLFAAIYGQGFTRGRRYEREHPPLTVSCLTDPTWGDTRPTPPYSDSIAVLPQRANAEPPQGIVREFETTLDMRAPVAVGVEVPAHAYVHVRCMP